MSVTVIPAQDTTSEIFNAWRTIEDIKNKAKQIALDQALAQQHIQSSQTIDQMNQAKLQMDQQQAKEYVSPESVANRREMMNTALQQKQGDVTEQSLKNEQSIQMNPLLLKHQLDSNRQARIAADSAQQNLNHMMEMWPDEKDFTLMTMKAKKYELISKGGLDPSAADLRAKIDGMKDAFTLQQLPDVAKAQQKTLGDFLNNNSEKSVENRIKIFSGAAGSLGVPGAKAAVAGMPGYENFGNVPDDSMGTRGQKDFTHNIVVSLAKDGDPSARDLLGEQIAVAMGAKPRPPQMVDEKTGKPYMTMEPDVIREAAKKVADRYIQKAKLNPQTGEYSIGDETGANAIQRRETVLQGTQKLPGGPTIPPSTPPVSGQAQSQLQSKQGTIDLRSQGPAAPTTNNAFDEIDTAIKRNADWSSQTYMSNRQPFGVKDIVDPNSSTNQGKGVDFVVNTLTDPEYTADPISGRIYNSTKSTTDLTQSQKKNNTSTLNRSQSIDKNLSIKDEDFRNRIQSAIKTGAGDESATAAQTARFVTIMSQMAKGFNENGKAGMLSVFQQVDSRYPRNSPNGITQEQAAQLISLIKHYGTSNVTNSSNQ